MPTKGRNVFVLEDLQQVWRQVADPNGSCYPDAVLELVSRKDQLPAPFVVQMDHIGKVTDPKWRSVIEASRPLCKCGIKRIVVPLERCRSYVQGPEVVIRLHQNLCLVPWGGDLRSTIVRLSYTNDDGLKIEWLPFVHGGDERFFDFLYIDDNELLPVSQLSKVIGGDRHPSLDGRLVIPAASIPLCRFVAVRTNEITLRLHAGVMIPWLCRFHWCL